MKNVLATIIAILRYAGLLTVLAVGSLIVLVIPTNTLRLAFCKHAGKLIMWILGITLIIRGELPQNKQKVIVSNHFGLIEIIAIMSLQGLRFVAQSGMSSYAFLGWAMRRTGQIFVERKKTKSKQHLEEVLAVVKSGEDIAFFPEGRVNDSRSTLRFKSALLNIVSDTYKPSDFTIVPLAIAYTGVSEKQRELIHYHQESVLSYLYCICCVGKSNMVIETLPEVDISGGGHDAKAITLHLETIISQKFDALLQE